MTVRTQTKVTSDALLRLADAVKIAFPLGRDDGRRVAARARFAIDS